MMPRRVAMGLIIAISLFLTGCWDKVEPNEQVYTLALGFDLDDDGNYRLCAQFSNPIAPALQAGGIGGGVGGPGQPPYWVYVVKGRTPFEAIRNLATVSTRIVNLTHTGVILISEKLARDGLGPLVDLIIREPSFRLSMYWAVVDGDVYEVLKAILPAEQAPSTGLLSMLLPTRLRVFGVNSSAILSSINEMLSPGIEAGLARIEVVTAGEGGEGEGSGASSGVETAPMPPIRYSGGAVFKGNKMVGWVDGRASRAMNMVRGVHQRGVFLVEPPAGDGLVSIDMSQSGTVMRLYTKGDEIRIKLEVKVTGHISDQTLCQGRVMDLTDPKVVDSLRSRFAEVIRNDINIAIEQLREFGSDALGFGNLIYRKRPKLWEKISHRWDEMFLTIPVDIDVRAEVMHPGLAISPPVNKQQNLLKRGGY